MHEALIDWAAGAGRDLPWRRTRDPWAVLVSEVMLQQTQVVRVVPRYHAFLRRFPTPADCAAAPAGEVIRAWAGLGYNRRALSLHRAAVATVERHGGRFPPDLDDLLALPGIGPYTARAVLAFAYERDTGVVDTNTARVLARTAGCPLSARETQTRADALVPSGRSWAWNQALLDLGATVCTRRRPRCPDCPLAGHCRWRLAGAPEPDPAQGTAGAARPQRPFSGSDRQGRGRLLRALRAGPLSVDEVPAAAGWPDDGPRAHRVAAGMVAEGLVRQAGGRLRLP